MRCTDAVGKGMAGRLIAKLNALVDVARVRRWRRRGAQHGIDGGDQSRPGGGSRGAFVSADPGDRLITATIIPDRRLAASTARGRGSARAAANPGRRGSCRQVQLDGAQQVGEQYGALSGWGAIRLCARGLDY
jgi:hypothetical protein